MTEKTYRERVKFFVLGLLVAVGFISLLGAKFQDETVLLDALRYRISAWGDGKAHGAFIVDSFTGQTKVVYAHKEVEDDKLVEKDYLNTPFHKIP